VPKKQEKTQYQKSSYKKKPTKPTKHSHLHETKTHENNTEWFAKESGIMRGEK